MNDVFIWTEIFNCGPLGKPAVDSFATHHPTLVLHVFGFEDDLVEIVPSDFLVLHKFARNDMENRDANRWSHRITGSFLLEGYEAGHLGTARLWAYIIKTRKESVLAHFDADIIFVGDAFRDILNAIDQDRTVVSGPRRMYKYNLNGEDAVRNQSDCVDTFCFAFRPGFYKHLPYSTLVSSIRGKSWINRVIRKIPLDFFDTFTYLLTLVGSIVFVDTPTLGLSAQRDLDSDFHSKVIEVRSAVGSGCAFARGFGHQVPQSYKNYALESYSIYAFYILNIETGIPRPAPGELERQLRRLDKEKWCFSN